MEGSLRIVDSWTHFAYPSTMSQRRPHPTSPFCRYRGGRLRTLIAVGLLGMTAALAGCATERPYVWIQDLPPAAVGEADGTVHPRDSIAVVVMDQPTMSGEFVVHDDGSYLQPTLGNVLVQGKTPAEIAADLQVRMKDMIVNPRVAVSISKVAPIRVNVVGEVKTPGSYELNRDRTLAGALAAAGWVTDFASKDRVYVARSGQNERRVRFALRELTSPESPSARFRLRDGDVVVVE